MTYLIRDLPVDHRPRERLLAHGAQTLSDSELLAVLLGTGAAGKNVIHLARELLVGGLQGLARADRTTLVRTRGIGPAKAARIAAFLELSRRLCSGPPLGKTVDMMQLGEKLIHGYSHLMQECFGAVLLDARQRVLKQKEIFLGTVNKALVSVRDIVRFALIEHAAGVVVFHNHPSGDPTPSDDDVEFTAQLKESLSLVDLELVDHLIIGAHRFCSMKNRGLLQPATSTGFASATSRSAYTGVSQP